MSAFDVFYAGILLTLLALIIGGVIYFIYTAREWYIEFKDRTVRWRHRGGKW